LRVVKVEVTARVLSLVTPVLRTGPTFRSAQIPPFDGNPIARRQKVAVVATAISGV
jgi:hypothetical protein